MDKDTTEKMKVRIYYFSTDSWQATLEVEGHVWMKRDFTTGTAAVNFAETLSKCDVPIEYDESCTREPGHW